MLKQIKNTGTLLYRWKTGIGMILFPPRCPACGRMIERNLFELWEDMFPQASRLARYPDFSGKRNGCNGIRKRNPWFCDDCQGRWKVIREPFCLKCGKKLRKAEDEYCRDCKNNRHLFYRNRALWEYSGEIKDTLHRFKYSGCADYAEAIGWEMAYYFGEWIKKERIRTVIPVPLHRARYRKRG